MEENESQRECKLCGVAINETIYKCLFCDTIYCNKCKTKHKHHYFMEIDNFKQYEEEIAEKKAKQEQLNNKIHIKSQSSIQDKLKNLKELKDQQLITDEEYADKKAQLLELI